MHDGTQPSLITLGAEKKHLSKLKEFIGSALEGSVREKVMFFLPKDFIAYIDEIQAGAASIAMRVRGYKVKVRNQAVDEQERHARREAIATLPRSFRSR